ncbi:hypothetical protein QL285_045557 [Trifolium repens]|nr:hypothetical protein QL285_045557 [Trifolium repens]
MQLEGSDHPYSFPKKGGIELTSPRPNSKYNATYFDSKQKKGEGFGNKNYQNSGFPSGFTSLADSLQLTYDFGNGARPATAFTRSTTSKTSTEVREEQKQIQL